MLDTLKLSDALIAANMPAEQARVLASELNAQLKDGTATKADIQAAKAELRSDIAGVRTLIFQVAAGQFVAVMAGMAILLSLFKP